VSSAANLNSASSCDLSGWLKSVGSFNSSAACFHSEWFFRSPDCPPNFVARRFSSSIGLSLSGRAPGPKPRALAQPFSLLPSRRSADLPIAPAVTLGRPTGESGNLWQVASSANLCDLIGVPRGVRGYLGLSAGWRGRMVLPVSIGQLVNFL
jgi:hypothetical protein